MSDQPEITNFDLSSLVLRDGVFTDITLNATGAETFENGQVLAFNASTGKWAKTVSGTAAVANAKAILKEGTAFSGAGDKLVRAIIGGEVDESQLVFDGTDTPDTIPASEPDSFRVQLRSYGIILRSPAEQYYQDNQP